MGGATDRFLGALMLMSAVGLYAYYTLWALILPFFPSDNAIHNLFPDRAWAVRIPAALLVAGLSVVGAFVGLVLVKSAQKRRELTSKRGA